MCRVLVKIALSKLRLLPIKKKAWYLNVHGYVILVAINLTINTLHAVTLRDSSVAILNG